MVQSSAPALKILQTFASKDEVEAYRELEGLHRASPLPAGEALANLSLFLTRASLSQILFMRQLYEQIVPVHGVIMEFGVRWGRNLALFQSLRAIYEPHNFCRKIVGFDTFEGFPKIGPEDGGHEIATVGAYSVERGYEAFLEQVLATQERLAPRPHLRKFELVKGDATETLERYLEAHPETVVALAYFDMDIYQPIKRCLELLRPCLTQGSVVGFDEIGLESFPGETRALKEVLGLGNYRLQRTPYSHYQSYLVIA
jgi:hypothetical protein